MTLSPRMPEDYTAQGPAQSTRSQTTYNPVEEVVMAVRFPIHTSVRSAAQAIECARQAKRTSQTVEDWSRLVMLEFAL